MSTTEQGRKTTMTRNLDPNTSGLAFFGAELRRLRLAAGWSQERCGDQMGYSGDLVGKESYSKEVSDEDQQPGDLDHGQQRTTAVVHSRSLVCVNGPLL